MSRKPHYLSRFHELVAEAEQAMHRFNHWDDDGTDANRALFSGILSEVDATTLSLIDFCVAHHVELYRAIQDGESRDSTKVQD